MRSIWFITIILFIFTGCDNSVGIDTVSPTSSNSSQSSSLNTLQSSSTSNVSSASSMAISSSFQEQSSSVTTSQSSSSSAPSSSLFSETVTLEGNAGDGEVSLKWNTIAGISALQVYVDTDSNPNGRGRLAILNSDAISYKASGLNNGTTYWFWVKYRTSDGSWQNSNAFSATPQETVANAPMLNQDNNPINDELSVYANWLSGNITTDKMYADNMITWQLPHGGFYKNSFSTYKNAWDGKEERSGWFGENKVELGTIDNDATVAEMLFMADVYKRSGDTKYRDAVRKVMDFILTMQHENGGFPQVYPARTGSVTYSNDITFNDNAMVRALLLLKKARDNEAPLDGDTLSTQQRSKAAEAIARAVTYILKSQIVQNGAKTVWCAQHDPDTCEPRGARSYELPSKSGKESVGIISFLMMQPQTQEIQEAVKAALAWYRNPDTQETDTQYIKRSSSSNDDSYNPIQSVEGKTMWYRFYEVDTDTPFFSGRLPTDNPPGVGKQYALMDIEAERRYGYEWGGNYGEKLLKYADSVGY